MRHIECLAALQATLKPVPRLHVKTDVARFQDAREALPLLHKRQVKPLDDAHVRQLGNGRWPLALSERQEGNVMTFSQPARPLEGIRGFSYVCAVTAAGDEEKFEPPHSLSRHGRVGTILLYPCAHQETGTRLRVKISATIVSMIRDPARPSHFSGTLLLAFPFCLALTTSRIFSLRVPAIVFGAARHRDGPLRVVPHGDTWNSQARGLLLNSPGIRHYERRMLHQKHRGVQVALAVPA